MVSAQQGAFAEKRNLPLGIDEALFAPVLDEVVFQQWLKRRCAWQLRIIGPPGSGKTMLAVSVIRRLRNSFTGSDNGIASLFFKNGSNSVKDRLFHEVMLSIYRQLSTPGGPVPTETWTTEELRKKLHQRILSLERAFLVVDDFDVCNSALFDLLDTEFSTLGRHGLNVMVTSRIPLHHDLVEMICDIDDSHTDATIWWCCKTCHDDGDDENADKEPFVICQICRDEGHMCRTCETDDLLHEPYDYVPVYLRGLLLSEPSLFFDFVSQALEVAHGDLGVKSKIVKKPPSSSLGKVLTVEQAVETIENVCSEAAGNIAVARLRLDIYQGARTADELAKVGDRLPDNFLAFFDAMMARIMQQDDTEKRLGLAAIVGATIDEDDTPLTFGQSFSTLEARLIEMNLLEPEPEHMVHHNLNQVLRVTAGVLWIGNSTPIQISPYHVLFGLYVSENYNEELGRTRSQMLEHAKRTTR